MSVINGESAPVEYGNYELFCDFADITENKEENKMFDYQLAQNGYILQRYGRQAERHERSIQRKRINHVF